MTPITPGYLERLRGALSRRAPATLHDGEAQRAAVALVVAGDLEPALLFVRRRHRLGDPWSGHAAFPGGFSSPADETPETTAARETQEETELALAETGTVLGRLDDVYPRSTLLPRVIVTPVVFAIPQRLPVQATDEVEQALWIPVAALYDSANRGLITLDLPTGRREFTAINIEGLSIWGLTERILVQLAEVAPPA